ncbi:hypothetical protein DFJ77DRAFT_446352 [Powellomyces hirtus]|nr:hypothetical protein DFJ77DRAFT_446352 [Powellomyces hirtus]
MPVDPQHVHVSYPSIQHFQKAVREIRKQYKHKETAIPLLRLRGTVKLHGTHADIVYRRTTAGNHLYFQSRNRVLGDLKGGDNCGFAAFMRDAVKLSRVETALVDRVIEIYSANSGTAASDVQEIMIAGEFCGSTIQQKIALSQLPRMFVIFGIQVNGVMQDAEEYSQVEIPDASVFHIFRVPPFRIELDLAFPDTAAQLMKAITDAVERRCPWGESFGVSGIGEGVVWIVENHISETSFYFKVKGEEHSVSKVRTLRPKTSAELRILSDTREFAAMAVQPARLEQGLDFLREMNVEVSTESTGKFIQWVDADVMKEEADDIAEVGLDIPELRREVSNIARRFFQQHC